VVVQQRRSGNVPIVEPTAEQAKARVERLARTKQAQREDAPRAMQEYRDAELAVRSRTEKLRAARLAREKLTASALRPTALRYDRS
jgi:hypothetical protein